MRTFNTFDNIEKRLNKGLNLSLLRIVLCLILLKKIFFQLPYVDLIYRGSDFLVPINKTFQFYFFEIDLSFIREHIAIFIGCYVILIILYLFGVGKNLTAFFVFVFYVITQRLCPQILNGGDNLLYFVLLYLAFANSYNFFSISKSKRNNLTSTLLSNLSSLSICIHFCLIYFVSAMHKINANVWFHGVANYYIFSLERFQGTSLNLTLAKNSFFVTISTYFTLLIELFYPILVWFKPTKNIMILSAVLLHMGIFIFMMLYDFQVIFITIQLLFLDEGFLIKHYEKIKIFYYRLLNKLKLNKIEILN